MLTLTRAFTIRKRLQSLIADTVSDLSYRAQLIVEQGTKSKISYDQTYQNLDALKHAEAELNAAIDEANANSEARKIIYNLEAMKSLRRFIEKAIDEKRNYEPEKMEWDPKASNTVTNSLGNYVVKKYDFDSQIDFEAELKNLNKTILQHEDLVSEINAKTPVEISPELAGYLENALEIM